MARYRIGVLAPFLSGSYFGAALAGIQRVTQQHKATLIAIQGVLEGTGQYNLRAHPLAQDQIDGWIVLLNTGGIQHVIQTGSPVVTVNTIVPGLPAVLPNNEAGMREAVLHLLDHGHQRIAFVGYFQETDIQQRYDGYVAALRERGVPLDPRLVIATTGNTPERAHPAARQLLALSPPCTAIAAATHGNAMGLLDAWCEAGVRVPDDLALLSFDGGAWPTTHDLPMTTVHVVGGAGGVGAAAAKVLLAQLAGHPVPDVTHTATMFITRRSCGCPALADAAGIPTTQLWGTPAWQTAQVQLVMRLLHDVQPSSTVLYENDALQGSMTLIQSVIAAVRGPTVPGIDALTRAWRWVGAGTLDVQQLSAAHRLIVRLAEQAEPVGHADPVVTARVERLLHNLGAALLSVSREPPVEILDAARALRTNYAVSMALLADTGTPDHALAWLRHTSATWGCLGLWDDEAGTVDVPLVIAGAYDRDAGAVPSLGQHFTPQRFPALEFLPASALEGGSDAVMLLPICTSRRDWGILALVGPINTTSETGYDPLTHWAAMLSTMLEREQLLASLKAAKESAEEAYHLQRRFLSVVSHELRTPLSLIVGLSDLLLRPTEFNGAALPAACRRDLQRIHTSARHLDALIRDVLDLARDEVDQLRLQAAPLALADILELVTLTGEQLARAKGLTWHVDLPACLPWVHGDRTRLQQVILNLISNAVKFTERGWVALSVSLDSVSAQELDTPEPTVTIAVRDSGPGIPAAEQRVVFDEFHQGGHTLTRNYEGIGLGLAISKRIVELHGGTIDVRSLDVDNHGATFTVTLPTIAAPTMLSPLDDQAYRARPSSGTRPTPTHQAIERFPAGCEDARTIVVVDDEPALLELHARMIMLHAPTYQMLTASSGAAALAIVQQQPVDLIVLDLMMPELDGFAVLDRLRHSETTRATPVLVLTAQVLDEAELDRLHRGGATVLEKGVFTAAETMMQVDALLNRSRKVGREGQRLVYRAMAYLHEHYAEPLGRDAVAQYIGVSEGHLTRSFQQELGLTPTTYLTRYRINQARKLLTGSDLHVGEIATAVGFASAAYFCRVFQREVGISPGAYRQRPRG